MSIMTSINLNEVEEQLRLTVTVQALRSLLKVLRKMILEISSGTEHGYTFDYASKVFSLYAFGFVREGTLLEKELAVALQTGNLQDQQNTAKELGSYLIGREMKTIELDGFTEKVVFCQKTRVGEKVATQLGPTWSFMERIRFQGYFRIWKHMKVAVAEHPQPSSLIPYYLDFIYSLYTSLDKFGYAKSTPQAWDILQPKFKLTIELEMKFLASHRYDIYGKFPRDLMKITIGNNIERYGILLRRFSAIVITGLKENKKIEALAASIQKFCTDFKFQQDTLRNEQLIELLQQIKVLVDTKKDAELYIEVPQLLLNIKVK